MLEKKFIKKELYVFLEKMFVLKDKFANKFYPLTVARKSTKYAKKHFDLIYGFNYKLNVCEVGSYTGMNAGNILNVLPVNKMYIVDGWEEGYAGTNVEKSCRKYLSWRKNQVVIIKKLSDEAVDDIPDDSIDFLYIDADHSYEWVKKDLNNYWGKVRENGIIGGHDYTGLCPDVIKAVNEFAEERGLHLFTRLEDYWFVKGKIVVPLFLSTHGVVEMI